MQKAVRFIFIICAFVSTYASVYAHAGEATLAVASNFLEPVQSLAQTFEQQTGHKLRISAGSTGKLYAQIVHGAPFDMFLAANSREPQRLEAAGKTIAGSRFTYALGRLALWAPSLYTDGMSLEQALRDTQVQRVSMANPKTAPYGAAAMEALEKLHLLSSLKGKIIRGENVSQAYQYVASGAAQVGFVALSQMKSSKAPAEPSYWLVPHELYSPIEQQAVLLLDAKDNAAAQEFYAFLKSPQARSAIEGFGYGVSPVAGATSSEMH